MTVIAWDGKSLAADRQIASGQRTYSSTKIFQADTGEVIAFTGYIDAMPVLLEWLCAGADPKTWPTWQMNEDQNADMIVATTEGLFHYSRKPIPMKIEAPFISFGSGSGVAMGALAMGADAEQAVRIACDYTDGCGMGVDVFEPFEAPQTTAPAPRARKPRPKTKKIPMGFQAPKAIRKPVTRRKAA